jgi:hypothetical protein
MSPITAAHADLLLAVTEAEARAARLLANQPGLREQRPPYTRAQADAISDHRTEAAGDMAAALDRIQPGLGERWMQAMFPEVGLDSLELML